MNISGITTLESLESELKTRQWSKHGITSTKLSTGHLASTEVVFVVSGAHSWYLGPTVCFRTGSYSVHSLSVVPLRSRIYEVVPSLAVNHLFRVYGF